MRVQQEKNDEFWLLWEIFKEYIKNKYYYGSVEKRTFSFSYDLQTDKKSVM